VKSGDEGSGGDDLVDPELELGGVREAGEDLGTGSTCGEEGHPALDLGSEGSMTNAMLFKLRKRSGCSAPPCNTDASVFWPQRRDPEPMVGRRCPRPCWRRPTV
jgi:hypothetical protein